VESALTLGRGPESPLPLDATGISREHLRLDRESDRFSITDLSSNGTWLNAMRLTRGEKHRLAPSDIIKIPGFEIRFEIRDGQATAPLVPEKEAAPFAAGGALQTARNIAASLSKVEKVLILLALATMALVIIYNAA
jgi:pSer/pThr/pTyr-binding forkhead associated (FHA) protein